jgi:hypothetical protein
VAAVGAAAAAGGFYYQGGSEGKLANAVNSFGVST